MRIVVRRPIYVTILALLWMVLQQHYTMGDLVIGFAVGAGVLYFARHFLFDQVRLRRPGKALRLAVSFAAEIVKANLQIAWLVIRPRLRVQPAFVLLPLDLRDDVSITVLANMITLTPGTLSVDVAPDKSALYIHCLFAPDPAAVVRQIKEQFEQPILESIECSPLPLP